MLKAFLLLKGFLFCLKELTVKNTHLEYSGAEEEVLWLKREAGAIPARSRRCDGEMYYSGVRTPA